MPAKSLHHIGIHTHRLSENPMEAAFAKKWRENCERGQLEQILRCGDIVSVSERDETVAATVIQWLGSPVGQSFVKAVMKEQKA